jgi:hypothetical protein
LELFWNSELVEESLNSVKVFWLEQDRLIAELYKLARKIGEEDENILNRNLEYPL